MSNNDSRFDKATVRPGVIAPNDLTGGRIMFTRQHFIAVADVLRDTKPNPEDFSNLDDYAERDIQWDTTLVGLVSLFEEDNPRFNRAHFIKYINGEAKARGRRP